jgi:putative glutathione S-transferase
VLIKGRWAADWQPVQESDRAGRFLRQSSSIRNWITRDGRPGPTGDGGFKAEADRYHLYVALICPWACRTLAVRALKKLETAISLSIVSPALTEQGWQFENFPGATVDHLHGAGYLHQLYTRHDSFYSGRATVPVLWDKQLDCMVNNESADIIRMLNQAFVDFSNADVDLYPQKLQTEIDRLNQRIYEQLNNGVYRAGFATSQAAYNEAYADVFEALDELEDRLNAGPYLFGEQLTETDIRLFVTLIRFDVAYYSLFKCNRQRIADYYNLSRYLERLYGISALRHTVDFEHIKQGYYSINKLNPSGIVPLGPDLQQLSTGPASLSHQLE